MKLGSLFDGSGGFPLAGAMCGIEPCWAAEVEPYPIAVTRGRFPNMKHLGSVTEVNGAEVEPVDIITFGSPCQDLSVAGKRAGLKHEANGDEETTRSGLFMEAVRIIKEMRRATNGEYPKYAIWENVPGAFSSHKGEDFRLVLENLIKICEPEAPPVPAPDKAGWPYADCIMGDGWSLAYRTLDAQYWGVPQRRRRIYLVLDLGSERAGEILSQCESLRGYFAEGRAPWKRTASYAERGTGADHREGKIPYTLKIRSGCEGGGKGALVQENMSATLATNNDQYLFQPVTLEPGIAAREGGHVYEGVSGTLRANAGDNQMAVAYPVKQLVLDDQGGSQITVRTDGKVPTLRAEMHGNVPCVMESAGFCPEQSAKTRGIGYGEEAPTLRAGVVPGVVCKCYDARGNGDGSIAPTITGDHNDRVTDYTAVVCCIDGDKIGKAERAGGSGLGIRDGDKMYTLTAKDVHGVCVPIHDAATRYAGKRGDKQDGKSNGLCVGDSGDPMYTLTSGDRHSVCYANTYQKVTDPLMANSHPGSYTGQDAFSDMLVAGIERTVVFDKEVYNSGENATGGHYIAEGGPAPTLRGTGHAPGVCAQYIVRRLTPTECARLQGFPDRWGDIPHKETLTDEEYSFWLNVRNTHAEINGRTTKEYTKEQMLKWYNKLQSDSSEYKMWGNGIALPNALYVMQGIAEVNAHD